MRVLVTRPRDDAEDTAAKLIARGHEPVIAPLIEIKLLPGDEIALDDVQAVLITSANGVRALAKRTKRRDVKVFTVGEQSAEVARALGFADIVPGRGGAHALAQLAMTTLSQRTECFSMHPVRRRAAILPKCSLREASQRAAKPSTTPEQPKHYPPRLQAALRSTLDGACSFRRARRAFSPTSLRRKNYGFLPAYRRPLHQRGHGRRIVFAFVS